MEYLKFSPCSKLEPFIECYFVWRLGVLPSTELVVESPPTGYCSIVINTGDPYYLESKKYKRRQIPAEFISGQAIYSYKLFLPGIISMAGVVFKPAGLASLFNLPVYEYTEERVDLSTVFALQAVKNLAAKLVMQDQPALRAQTLEDFVLEQTTLLIPQPDAIDVAANKIVLSNGLLHVSDLWIEAYMSRRNFERRFFKKVGLSPKYYARIRRMSYIAYLVAGKAEVDWQSVFYNCEYYDQSHFTKDFIEFTGRTPQQYLRENQELVKYVDKPKKQPLGQSPF